MITVDVKEVGDKKHLTFHGSTSKLRPPSRPPWVRSESAFCRLVFQTVTMNPRKAERHLRGLLFG